ncbi:sel1 repeat family protein [bacterium]|nr:sel1 repeat family protein [bacterium]NBX83942.1 sel1 repeat family protein [bacterium]
MQLIEVFAYLFIFHVRNVDTASMELYFRKRSLFRALTGFLLLISGTIFCESPALPKCSAQHLGKWVDLNSLNSIEFNSECGFTYTGASCIVSGEYFSTPHSKGSLFLYNKMPAPHSTCLAQGEHTCTFSVEQESLVLKCPPQSPVKWTRVTPNDSTPMGELEGRSKTLFLLEHATTYTLKLHLEKLAKAGDPEAAAALGYNFFYGSRGFTKDYVEALYWNRLAASRGSRTARVLTGTQYLYGLGAPKDLARAEEYFLAAAQEDDVVPQKALAGMYLMEPKNLKKRDQAIRWLTRATQLGDREAKSFLTSLKPEEVKNIRSLCALFETHQKTKPDSPLSPIREASQTTTESHEPERCVATTPPSSGVSSSRTTSDQQLFLESETDLLTSGVFWIGGGVTGLGIQSSADTFNDLRFLVSFKTNPIRLWGDLKLEGIFDYAMPFNSRLKSMSFSQIEGQLHYDIAVAPSVALKPTFSYLRLQFEDAVTRLGIVGGQIGVGMGVEVLLNDTWSVELAGRTLASGRGSLVSGSQTLHMSLMQSNYALQLFVEKKSPSHASYGLGLQLQNVALLGTQSDTIRLTQYAGQFFWNF